MNYETLVNTDLPISFPQLLNDRSWELDGQYAIHYPCNQDTKLSLLNYVIEPNVTYTVSFNIVEANTSPLLKLGFNTVQYTYTTPQQVTVDILTTSANRKITFWGNGYLKIANFNIKRKDDAVVADKKPTIVWDEKNNKWASFRSYKPEGGFSLFNNLYTYNNGELWVHQEGAVRNNFYGEQFNSFINFPISSASVRNYQSVSIHANQVMATTTDGIKTELGHVSDLIEADFDTSEGIHYANFLRDKLTDIINGERLKGRYITLELQGKDGSKKIQLFKVEVKSTLSSDQTYSREIKGIIPPPPTTYQSAVKSGTATKNNCGGTGSGGTATLTTTVGQFTSLVSQQDADNQAQQYINFNLQAYANATASCIYLSTIQSQTKNRNNCGAGFVGTPVTLSTLAGQFTSTISQLDADGKAVDYLNTNSQTYANTNGTCIVGTNYQSSVKSGSATRNNCGAGKIGSTVTLSSNLGQFTSITSQLDADTQAQNWVDANKQANANTNGTCTTIETVGNDYRSKVFTRNNCGAGQYGSTYTEFRNINTYFDTTKALANAQADSAIDASGQANANSSGSCSSPEYFTFVVKMYSTFLNAKFDPSDPRSKSFEFRNGLSYVNLFATKLVSTEITNNGVEHTFSVPFNPSSPELLAIYSFLTLKDYTLSSSTGNVYMYLNGSYFGGAVQTIPTGFGNTRFSFLTGSATPTTLTSSSVVRLELGAP